MKARLGLAVASAIEPELLLIDEVLGVGDPNFKEKSTDRIILERTTQNVAPILRSHHPSNFLNQIQIFQVYP